MEANILMQKLRPHYDQKYVTLLFHKKALTPEAYEFIETLRRKKLVGKCRPEHKMEHIENLSSSNTENDGNDGEDNDDDPFDSVDENPFDFVNIVYS